MSEGFEEIAQRLRVEKGNQYIDAMNVLASVVVEQVRNRPARYRDPAKLNELVAVVAMTAKGDLTSLQLATLAAVALIQLAGVDTSVEAS